MCARAIHPDPANRSVPSVAAVCVTPRFVPTAVEATAASEVGVASVAGNFPTGRGPLAQRVGEIRDVVAMGAREVDIVLDPSLVRAGRYEQGFDELVAAREASAGVHLKVILEVGELGTYQEIRRASMLAMVAGADFLKTSTGKARVGATLPAALCMMEAARDFHRETAHEVGIKVAGGIRRTAQAVGYLVALRETLGAAWMTPQRFRIGASSLLDDLLRSAGTQSTGRPETTAGG